MMKTIDLGPRKMHTDPNAAYGFRECRTLEAHPIVYPRLRTSDLDI